MIGKFLFLGTGSSTGIPVVGCKCPVCTSSFPLNRRLRPSGLLRVGGKVILLDAGPDFRQQALLHRIDHLDGLILTHTHYDHIAGIDELRIFYVRSKKSLPCLLSKESFEEARMRYYYLFRPPEESKSLSAQLDFQLLEGDEGSTHFLGVPIDYVSYFQCGMKVNGFRIGNFAYISDIRSYEKSLVSKLQGVEVLVLSALREDASPFHLSIQDAVHLSEKIGAKQTFLTHLSHSVDHERVGAKLPSGIQLGFDGLEMEFTC